MTRLGSLVLCTTFGTALLACSSSDSSTKDPFEIVPLDNDIPGWMVDQGASSDPSARAMTATTLAGVLNLIDGGAEPFFMEPYTPKMFLWQNYTNKSLTVAGSEGAYVKLYILHMPSAEQASGLYSALLTTSEYGRKAGTADDWAPTDPPVGTASRIQDTGTQWWVNFHKDVFYIDLVLDPSFGTDFEPRNPELKQAAVSFAQGIANRI